MNNITIELCAEDRARLDKLTAALEQRAEQTDKWAPVLYGSKQETTEKAPTAPTEPQETPAPITDTPKEEKPTEAATATPTVTLEQIQQKVVQLAAGNDGAKKAQVREVISAYGAKVSDLRGQPEKWDEVWAKLTALESEG